MAGKTITVNSGVTAPNKVEVTVYLEDESGNEHLCDAQTTSSNIGVGTGGDDNGGAVCGDGSCNGLEICGDDDVAPACNTDCNVCREGAEPYC